MFVFSDRFLSNDVEFSEIVNPVINSAKGSLLMLGHAGVPEAVDFMYKLRLDGEMKYSKTDFEKILTDCFALIQVIRYKSLTVYAEKLHVQNIIDLGCGFSPRSLYFKDKPNVNYIGIDLPAIIKDLKNRDNAITYAAADMTNLSSLQKALKNVTGSVLIITEGILSYFTESELKTVIGNIHTLLTMYKGVWITPDFYNYDVISAVMNPVFGEEIYKKISAYLNSTKKTEVGTEFRSEDVPATTLGKGFLEGLGFMEKKIDFITKDVEIPFLSNFAPEVRKNIVANYKNFQHSLLYLDENFAGVNDIKVEIGSSHSQEFSFNIEKTKTDYVIYLSGRLDTISSPELLSFYENSLKNQNEMPVIIDCEKLDYISSAGLRVLMIMYKGSGGNMSVINQNNIVDEVLDQTGYKQFFCK